MNGSLYSTRGTIIARYNLEYAFGDKRRCGWVDEEVYEAQEYARNDYHNRCGLNVAFYHDMRIITIYPNIPEIIAAVDQAFALFDALIELALYPLNHNVSTFAA